MFKDGNVQFIMYVLGIGILIVLAFCIMQVYILGTDVPFLEDLGLGIGGSTSKGEFIYDNLPSTVIKEDKDYQAIVDTNLGKFTIELFEENAPISVNNFVFLASKGYYDKVKVHRVLKDLLFQTGDRNTLSDNNSLYGTGNPGYTFADEINWASLDLSTQQITSLTEEGYSSTSGILSKPLQRYSLAMANSGPNTNGSQFFVVMADNLDPQLEDLNGKHTVFGKVIEGYDALDKINNSEVDISNKNMPLPLKDIVINRIDIIELDK